MATTRSTGKISPQWVRQTRKSLLRFLHATHFPPVERHGQRGKTCVYADWLRRLIGALALTWQEHTSQGIHRMTCRFWNEVCGRQVQLPPLCERQIRTRFKKRGDQLGTAPGYEVQIFPPEYLE